MIGVDQIDKDNNPDNIDEGHRGKGAQGGRGSPSELYIILDRKELSSCGRATEELQTTDGGLQKGYSSSRKP